MRMNCIFLICPPPSYPCLSLGLSELSLLMSSWVIRLLPVETGRAVIALWAGFWCGCIVWSSAQSFEWISAYCSPPSLLQRTHRPHLCRQATFTAAFLCSFFLPIMYTPALASNDSPLCTQFPVRVQFAVLLCCMVLGVLLIWGGNCSWCHLQLSSIRRVLSRKCFQFWRGQPRCDNVHAQNQKCQVIHT